jgi:hypothetical protein
VGNLEQLGFAEALEIKEEKSFSLGERRKMQTLQLQLYRI